MWNIIFLNRYLAECQFRDTSFERKSFCRIVILSNVFFSNRHLAEYHFPKLVKLPKLYNVKYYFLRYLAECQFRDTSFDRKSFSQIVILPNVFFSNCHLAEYYFPELVKLPKLYNVKYYFLE